MTKRKMMPLEELRALCGGKGLSAFYVEAKTPEEETRLKSEIAYLEGRFSGLPKEQQAECHWKAAALIYAESHMQKHRDLGVNAGWFDVASRIGASAGSLKRWRKQVHVKPFGSGYWHLLLPKLQRQQHNMSRATHRFIMRKLQEGVRPSIIAGQVETATGVKLSVRSIQRFRLENEQALILPQTRFINRFK